MGEMGHLSLLCASCPVSPINPSLTKLSLQYQAKGAFCDEIFDVKLLV